MWLFTQFWLYILYLQMQSWLPFYMGSLLESQSWRNWQELKFSTDWNNISLKFKPNWFSTSVNSVPTDLTVLADSVLTELLFGALCSDIRWCYWLLTSLFIVCREGHASWRPGPSRVRHCVQAEADAGSRRHHWRCLRPCGGSAESIMEPPFMQ